MKIAYNWLRQLIDFPHTPEALASALTDAGLEVEHCSPWSSIPGGLDGVVIGKVLTCERHPNADRLHVTTVDVGDGNARQIVCGAPNVAAGQTVVVALPGAVLHPTSGEPFEIRKSKIRGESSEGMICAEDEIGLGESHAGIMILPDQLKAGSPAADYFGVEHDWIFEIGLTPNRADAASHLGVARDIRALIGGAEIKLIDADTLQLPDADPVIKPRIEWEEACIRYSAVELVDLRVGPSPDWMQRALRKIGLRPINNVVDVTNYIMHEIGQPLHAFDADQIKGDTVLVGKQPAGTAFVTLDGSKVQLGGEELMISDAAGGLCIAGVYGGQHSGVTENTKRVFLESACFHPVAVRKSARRHGLHTDSSFRFERGTDPEITVYALKRAAAMMCELAGARISSRITDLYPKPVEPVRMPLDLNAVNRLIGAAIPRTDVVRILTDLGIRILTESETALQLEVPAFKVDVTRPADVVEEILRIYGYNAIPLPERLSITPGKTSHPDPEQVIERTALHLAGKGYREILTNSLIAQKHSTQFGADERQSAVEVLNPLSADLSILRHSMLPGALEAISYNLNRKQAVLSLFEFGKVYFKSGPVYNESGRLGIYITGPQHGEHWKSKSAPADVYQIRGVMDSLLDALLPAGRRAVNVQVTEDSSYNSAVRYSVGKKTLAILGQVRPELAREAGISQPVFAAEVELELLVELSGSAVREISGPPRFPEVRRDLSMVLDRSVTYAEIEKIAYAADTQLLRMVDVFDVYEGDKIEAGKKSYALSFILRDDEATLQDKQIDAVMQKLMKQFESKLGAVIRKA